MKIPFWTDPNRDIQIIEPTEGAMNEYGHLFGSDKVILTQKHIDALLAGKMLAWNDSEYSTFVVLRRDQ